MKELKVSVKDIPSKRFKNLKTNDKKMVKLLLTTIAVRDWESIAFERVKDGTYIAYQSEKNSNQFAGWEIHMLIKKNSEFSRALYKPTKMKVGNFEKVYSAIRIENEEIANEIKSLIPTLGKIKDILDKKINSLPKPIREFLLS